MNGYFMSKIDMKEDTIFNYLLFPHGFNYSFRRLLAQYLLVKNENLTNEGGFWKQKVWG